MSKQAKLLTATIATVLLLAVPAVMVLAAEGGTPAVQVHGYMQNRVYFGPGATPEFRSERISVSASAALPEDSTAYVELYYHPWAPASGLYLESAYYETPLGAGKIRIGKGRRITFGITPAYPNRRTSNYGLVSEAFTQDRIQGVQYTIQKDALDAAIGIHTGYRLGVRQIGEIPGDSIRNLKYSVPHLCFRDPASGGGTPDSRQSSKLDISARLGGRWENGLKAGISALVGRLDDGDLQNLRTDKNVLAPGTSPPLLPGATSKTKRVLAFDYTYKHPEGLVTQGEFYAGKVSSLKYNAWNFLVGWEPPVGWKFFVRYAQQNMGSAANPANPLSWDTRQLSISAVQPLRKGLWMQYEMEINTEKPGSVKNNIFFVELFSGF
ncbi:MAG: hypothetical protein ACUVTZ_08365 [Armatimonadota bacterium]